MILVNFITKMVTGAKKSPIKKIQSGEVITISDDEDNHVKPRSKLDQKAVVLMSPLQLKRVQRKLWGGGTDSTPDKKLNLPKKPNAASWGVNQFGETRLHINCRKGNTDEVEAILKCPGVNVNAMDHNEWTPLHEVFLLTS